MVFSKNFSTAILQCALVVFPILIQAHDQQGFISIDCGITDVLSYTDEKSDLVYFSDANFTEAGENRALPSSYRVQNNEKQLWNIRSFPQGSRSCYTLKPTRDEGTKYLIRARFVHGNYDEKEAFPVFDLHLGVDLWDTVEIKNATTITTKEIIHVPSSDQVHVCLVNIGRGTPFISVLELRPLDTHIYESDETGSSLLLQKRYDFSSATDQVMRYKDDEYDRLWSPLVVDIWNPSINISRSNEESIEIDDYQVPFTVMSTAYTQNRGTSSLGILRENLNSSNRYILYMYFAELENLQRNQSREFNIYINGDYWSGPFAPEKFKTVTVSNPKAIKTDNEGIIDIWLNNTDTSTLPPLINALDMYMLKELSRQETNQKDVEAISNIKLEYKLNRMSWQGDPCAPVTYMWDGLDCGYNADDLPRIVSLNLSASGLKGEIVPFIASLTMLKYLDLSNNSLSGTVPEFLAQLSLLRVLNLKGNNFTGPIPDALSQRSKKGLFLSIDPSTATTPLCLSESCGKKKNFVVPLVAALAGVLFVLLTTVIVLWNLQRRRQEKAIDSKDVYTVTEDCNDGDEISKKQQFTYSDIQTITNNFERVLGEGGFGKVYHGYLNGNNLAVKMLSTLNVQGYRQFHAELKLLLRVHHKNLTTLIGYCNEGSNLGLIYEYMAMGNLRSHLSGRNQSVLAWEDRLRIATDTAQGLEYLHNGCKPPIIHRDVKSTNILLNEKFQAKLGDFGLSKIFPFESGTTSTTHGISTSVIAGTPGYLDPEYYETNRLNEKSDVFSFGVVLLEIITARPVFGITRENNHIIQWVSSMLAKGDVKSILDPKLEGGNFDINTVWKVIEIAMACVSRTSTNRPTMSRVAFELKDCLTTNITRKDGHFEAECSKDSDDMIYKNMSSQYMSPQAR